MPRDPISERKKRIELLKSIVRKAGKIHVHQVYSALLSTYGVSRRTIDDYIDECIYMGLMIRNNDHLVWIEKKAGEK
jgi:hypothetical protein